MAFVSVEDFREVARKRLPHFLFEYIDGGAYDEETLKRNRSDLKALTLRQRVLKDMSDLDVSVDWFNAEYSLPVGLAPIGLAGMNRRRGERQASCAAAKVGVPFTLSTLSVCPLKEVAIDGGRPFWFQLYMMKDRALMRDLLAEAQELGCGALIFTVDMPVPGTRYRDYRSGLAGADGVFGDLRRVAQAMARPAWAWDVGLWGRPHNLGNVALGRQTGLEDFFQWMRDNFDASIGWKELEFIRSEWRGPLILKGILDIDDAKEAVAIGADGIVVSNHGGRQLDGVSSTATALAGIGPVVRDDITVFVDGGVRSGLDVLRMLALGAHGVLLGRAWAYALAAAGEEGVARLLNIIEMELKVAMTLTGTRSVRSVSSDILMR